MVVDIPPSRSALDFLDAPKRLGSFLDGRFIRLLTAPAKVGGRASLKVFSAGVSLASGIMTKLLGGDFLRDVQTFVAAMDTMFGGFRQRADETYALLSRPETAFVVVAAPERDAMREAGFFIERLATDRMPLAGVLVNRVHTAAAKQLGAGRAEDAAAALEEIGGHDLAASLLRPSVPTAAARHRPGTSTSVTSTTSDDRQRTWRTLPPFVGSSPTPRGLPRTHRLPRYPVEHV